MKSYLKKRRNLTRGITLLETVISMMLLAIAIVGIIQGFNMGYSTSLRSVEETEASLAAVQRLEEIMAMPYSQLDSNTFSPEYLTLTQLVNGTYSVSLSWSMTTTVTQSTSPEYKQINLECSWSHNGIQRYVDYVTIKSP